MKTLAARTSAPSSRTSATLPPRERAARTGVSPAPAARASARRWRKELHGLRVYGFDADGFGPPPTRRAERKPTFALDDIEQSRER